MSYKEILNDLKRRIFKPVYFLCGEEPYFIDKISDYVEANVLNEDEREFNQTIFYGKEVTMEQILETAKRFPMMSEFQVVIVKEAQNLKDFASRSGKGDEGDDDESMNEKSSASANGNALLHYLENPQATTILVFCHKYKKPDKRQKLGKLLTSKAVYFESDKLKDWDMPKYISGLLQEMQLKVVDQVPYLLAEYLGNDISKIVNELDKLAINIPQGTTITLDHIQKNIGISKDYNVFELQDAIGKKDILKANKIIQYFNANPKDHFISMTLGFLYGYFLKVLMVHFSNDKSKFGIAKTLGVPPFVAEGYETAARNYPTAKLKAIFSYLREADVRSKGVDNYGTEHSELQKELIFKILH